ncbi:NmrA family NAD(P)-binding protein [Thermocrispum sp.]|uniref:NmrA family NAD(P)-binding protein n=1 Tax=Thermocrispum sp. TaxID=2060768 RepID=UPI002579E178|nr:NmrA family NAD(P)-binding protein [Thermocrispum sp.]
MKVLVCGVGGISGNTVASVLSERGFAVRALVHRPERKDEAAALGAQEVVVADYDDEESVRRAAEGVDAIYFVAASYRESEPRWVEVMLRAATGSGADRFVYHSVLHPYTPSMPHHERKAKAEILVRASGLRWTILQPAMYAQTVLRIRQRSRDGELHVPYDPDAKFAVIDVRDIGACAASVLADDAHVYACYELAGAEIQSVREMAATMDRVLGEPRRIVQVDPKTLPLPPAWGERQRHEYALMCQEYDAHGLLGSSTVAELLLGRKPTPFADVVARDVRDAQTGSVR